MEFFLFYFFSSLFIFCSFKVVFSSHPVYSVLFLVLCFCASSCILFLIEIEFLGILFVIIYVGAIAVLFLFVVIMLRVNEDSFIVSSINLFYFLFSFFFGSLFFIKIFFYCLSFFGFSSFSLYSFHINWFIFFDNVNLVQNFGQVLYSYFLFSFLFAGFLLLIAMIGSLVLTLNNNSFSILSKHQLVHQQLSRKSRHALFLVKNFLFYLCLSLLL